MSYDLEQEEAALGPWPRRLLHIPTMTSHEWSSGNIYGAHQEPEYNIITYTWGRWRLQDNEAPQICGLPVKNIPWPIPRVKPSAFTATSLQDILNRATGFYPQDKNRNFSGANPLSPVEFVWLDIACIDQREDSPGSAAEVGRQADIFNKARQVFVWLHKLPHKDLFALLESFEHLEDLVPLLLGMKEPEPEETQLLQDITKSLMTLTRDPWFSSMWTLQEAFLRNDALLLSQEGLPVVGLKTGGPNIIFHNILQYCYVFSISDDDQTHLGKIREIIQNTGLQALSSQNALAVFVASARRTSSRDEDRIYAIQQIFCMRLGSTSTTAMAGHKYSLPELEIQFGTRLLEERPISSQMHHFMQPSVIGRGWLVNTTSVMPINSIARSEEFGEADAFSTDSIEEEKACCRLSVKFVKNNYWGTFSGMLRSFTNFYTAIESLEQHPEWAHIWENETLLKIYLDNIPEISAATDFDRLPQGRVPGMNTQRRCAQWLAHISDSRQRTFMLLLGHLVGHGPYQSSMTVALLLLESQDDNKFRFYRRIGFCFWDPIVAMDSVTKRVASFDPNDPQLICMPGTSQLVSEEFWEPKTGYFG